nr:glycosyltransferase [Roseivirga pacifica]
MTYNRPDIIADTVDKIFQQSYPPQKLLVVDNSEDSETETVIKSIENSHLEYVKVGYNSGPAGAAKKGLEILVQEGYQWIYWGDDDDPPSSNNIFEKLLKIAINEKGVGAVGSIGNIFYPYRARVFNISNTVLKSKDVIEVDCIPGGHNFIVSGSAIRESGVLPTANLFFGFEELDFCLSLKKEGYRLLVDSKTWYQNRLSDGNCIDSYRFKSSSGTSKVNYKRMYFSHRNMLYILNKNNSILGLMFLISKGLVKPFLLLTNKRFDFLKVIKVYFIATLDFLFNNYNRK